MAPCSTTISTRPVKSRYPRAVRSSCRRTTPRCGSATFTSRNCPREPNDDGPSVAAPGPRVRARRHRRLGRAAFAISTVTPQTMKLIDYTANAQTLSAALAQLNARPGSNDGGQLLDGIAETAQELQKREARRPIILALTVGGQEHSTLPAHHVLDKLRQSGASLHVLTVVNTALRSQPAATSAGALIGENMNLGLVLGDGPKQSGGFTHEIVAATGIANGLQQLAQMLRQQYLIEYTLPDGVTPGDKLSVSLKRKGLSIRAPTRIPDK